MLSTMVGWQRKVFVVDHLKRPEMTFFTILSYWKTSDLHLILDDFYKKRIGLKNCVKINCKYSELSNEEFRIHAENDHLCFNKNCTTFFIFISSYFAARFFFFASDNLFMILQERSTSVVFPFHSLSSLEKLILQDWKKKTIHA